MTASAHRYLDIVERHIDHWNVVDADVDRPIRIGEFGLMELRFQRDVLAEILRDLNALTRRVDALRAQRDVLCRRLWAQHQAYHGWSNPAPEFWTGTIVSDFEATARMWSEQNAAAAAPRPGLPQFSQDIVDLKEVFALLAAAEEAENLKKMDREASYGSIRQRLAAYHEALRTIYRPEHAFAAAAPVLEAPAAESISAPALSAVWDMSRNAAYLEWTLSSDPMVKAYQIRRSTAVPYDPSLEVVVDVVEAPGMHYATIDGLESMGGTAFYRVVGLTEQFGEAPSNVVGVTRPEAVPAAV